MKIRHCKEKVVVFMFSIILVMGIAACSLDTNGGTDPGDAAGPTTTAEAPVETATPQPQAPTAAETDSPQPEVQKKEITQTPVPENDENQYSDAEEIGVGDPIIGIVDQFSDTIIVIKDAGDPDLVYYFSTQNAQVVEGDSPIAVGDRVAITYQGVMGDEEHPGEAVKVVPESMMYQ